MIFARTKTYHAKKNSIRLHKPNINKSIKNQRLVFWNMFYLSIKNGVFQMVGLKPPLQQPIPPWLRSHGICVFFGVISKNGQKHIRYIDYIDMVYDCMFVMAYTTCYSMAYYGTVSYTLFTAAADDAPEPSSTLTRCERSRWGPAERWIDHSQRAGFLPTRIGTVFFFALSRYHNIITIGTF